MKYRVYRPNYSKVRHWALVTPYNWFNFNEPLRTYLIQEISSITVEKTLQLPPLSKLKNETEEGREEKTDGERKAVAVTAARRRRCHDFARASAQPTRKRARVLRRVDATAFRAANRRSGDSSRINAATVMMTQSGFGGAALWNWLTRRRLSSIAHSGDKAPPFLCRVVRLFGEKCSEECKNILARFWERLA